MMCRVHGCDLRYAYGQKTACGWVRGRVGRLQGLRYLPHTAFASLHPEYRQLAHTALCDAPAGVGQL